MLARDIEYDVVTAYVARRLEQASPSTVLYEVKLLRRMFRLAPKPRSFPFGQLPALADLLREQRERTSALEREHGRIVPGVQRHPVLRDKATPSLAHPPSGEQRFGLRLAIQPPFRDDTHFPQWLSCPAG